MEKRIYNGTFPTPNISQDNRTINTRCITKSLLKEIILFEILSPKSSILLGPLTKSEEDTRDKVQKNRNCCLDKHQSLSCCTIACILLLLIASFIFLGDLYNC